MKLFCTNNIGMEAYLTVGKEYTKTGECNYTGRFIITDDNGKECHAKGDRFSRVPVPPPYECALTRLDIANEQRMVEFPGKTNFSEWTLNDWGVSLAEEAGEVCGVLKRFKRGDMDEVLHLENLADELGDVVIVAAILARKKGLSLAACVINKFNKKSDEIGCNIKI